MVKLKLAVAIRRLNEQHGTNWTYQQAYMAAIAALIPVERDETDRFLLVDEDNLDATGEALSLIAAKKSAVKPAPTRPARPRASRSASAA